MRSPSKRRRSFVRLFPLGFVAGALLVSQAGCLGVYANLMHAAGADKVPAAYDGLKNSKVAVVTLTENGMFTDDVSARILGRNTMMFLGKEVKKIELIREDKITNWRDTHGWDEVQFEELGQAVGADKVLVVEVANLKLRDGATLYRGRADVDISVIDSESGNELYRHQLDEFTYPVTAGQYTSETTEARFRKLYLGILAKRIARQFYPFDAHEDFALDSIVAR